MINGIITALLLAGFIAIVFWAWSPRQGSRFDEASRLPLDDSKPAGRKAGDQTEPRK